jgi:predicted DNA-binding transcriptional regulator AlpA
MAKPVEKPLRKVEAAEFLGVSLPSLDRLMRKGLPFYRLAGRPVFYASEINSWIKEKRK